VLQAALGFVADWLTDLAPSTLAQWVGGAVTFAAVLVALLRDEVFRYLRRPKIIVRIKAEPPDCLLSAGTTRDPNGKVIWTGNTYWLRLWIENIGNRRAEQVQVFVAELNKRDANKKFIALTDFAPMNLRWSNARDWRNPEIFAPGISHKMGKHCDLLSVSDPLNPRPGEALEGYDGQCVGTLQLEVFPSNNRHRLTPGDYVLKLIIGAANGDPVTAYVELSLKGTWSPDLNLMFRDHLGVRVASRSS
jgi:hypothetical protein